MVKVLRTVYQELALTFRGFLQFYLDFLGLIRPDAAPRRTLLRTVFNLLVGGIVIGIIIFYIYAYPTLDEDGRLNAALGLLIGGVLALGYAGWFVATNKPRTFALKQLGKSVVVIGALLVLFGHPQLPGWGKLVASAVCITGVIVVARGNMQRMARATMIDRPLLRGRIIGLLPFYLVAVCCLFWGLNTTLEKQPGQAWFLQYQQGNYETPNNPVPVGGEDVKPKDLVDELQYTRDINARTFWGYTLQRCTGIAMAPAIEKAYWWVIFPIGDAMGFELTPPQEFSVGRIMSFHVAMEILENVVGILTTIFFLGLFADIAVIVDRRIKTGQVDLDLTKDHGVALLTAVHGLSGREEAKLVRGSWQMIAQINDRAVDGLINHLEHRDPQVRAAAAWALGELGATRAAGALQRTLDAGETSRRARAAMMDALARLAPIVAQPYLKAALRGDDVVLAHTAFASQSDIVKHVLEPTDESVVNGESGKSADVEVEAPDDEADPPPAESPAARAKKQPETPAAAVVIDDTDTRRLAQRRPAIIEAARATLIECLDTPHDTLRDRTVRLLAKLSGEETGALVLKRLDQSGEQNPRWVQGALLTLGRIQANGAARVLINHAKDAPHGVTSRVAALRGLGGHDVDEGIQVLRAALADGEPLVRSAACAGLARRGNAVDLPKLVELLKGDPEADVRLAAIRAQRRICSRLLRAGLPLGADVTTPLRELASDQQDSLLRDQACYALAELRDADAVEILLKLLPDPEATDAVGMLGAPDLRRPLEPALRKRAVEALKGAADKTGNELVMSRERNAPLEALGHFGRDATAALQALYVSRTEDQRVIAHSLAAASDATRPNDPCVTFLVGQFDARNRTSAEWLCPALAQTRHPAAARALRNALHTGVAPLAARALGDMHDPDSLPDLLQLANSNDEAVRDAVYSALRRLSADPAFSDDISRGLKRQVRVMGARATNVMRFMVRMAGSLLTLSDDGMDMEDDTTPRVTDARPEDLLAEFG